MIEAPVIVPAYNPDSRLARLAEGLLARGAKPLLIVDDGSTKIESRIILSDLEKRSDVILLRHACNSGKGAALKTAFRYIAEHFPDAICAATCDCDGQHDPDDVSSALEVFAGTLSATGVPHLILGARKFSSECVPWKSRAGNLATRWILRLLAGYEITDTQTGLRVIPAVYLTRFAALRGDGFEYETEMLLSAVAADMPIREFRIRTVYHNNNRETNFRPLPDGLRIYSVIVRGTLRDFPFFVLASISSAFLDIGLFALFFYIVFPDSLSFKLGASIVSARCFSCTCNYFFNRYMVFRGRHIKRSGIGVGMYYLFCIMILALSYLLTKAGSFFVDGDSIVFLKAAIDLGLFFTSYTVQRFLIFPRIPRTVKRR